MSKKTVDICNKKNTLTSWNFAVIDFHGEKPNAEVRNFLKANHWIWNSYAQPPVWQPNLHFPESVKSSYKFILDFNKKFNSLYDFYFSKEAANLIIQAQMEQETQDVQIDINELSDNALSEKTQSEELKSKNEKLEEIILQLQKQNELLIQEIKELRENKVIESVPENLESSESVENESLEEDSSQETNVKPEENLTLNDFVITENVLEKLNEVAQKEAKENVDYEEQNVLNDSENEELTDKDLEICKTIFPLQQYYTILKYVQGEEGEFFKNKLKSISQNVQNSKLYTTDGMKDHPMVLRYFYGDSEWCLSEIDIKNKEGYGYCIVNGDLDYSEWGYVSLDELSDINAEVDIHFDDSLSIERHLMKKYPGYNFGFNKVEENFEQQEKIDEKNIQENNNELSQKRSNEDIAHDLADWIIQDGLENSESMENCHISFDDIFENTEITEEWLSNNIAIVYDALEEHNDNELIDFDRAESGNKEFNLFFCSNSDFFGENRIFKRDNAGKWVRKTEQELHDDIISFENEKGSAAYFDKISGKYFTIERSDQYGFVYNIYDDNYELIDGGVAYDTNTDGLSEEEIEINESEISMWDHMNLSEAIDELIRSENIDFNFLNTEHVNFEELEFKTSKLEKERIKNNYEQNAIKQESSPITKSEIQNIREQCRKILKKSDSEITEEDKKILSMYEGGGGLNEENRSASAVLNEFYTPANLVEKVWELIDVYSPEAKTVLEPSSGIGKFAVNRENNQFTLRELDDTSARIAQILHPNAQVIKGAYQAQFFDENGIARVNSYNQPLYDVVVGNPPYGKYIDEWKGKGEGKEFDRYEEYFIAKGLEALKDDKSILAMVVPSGFLNTGNDRAKEIIASKGILIDAYRLPRGTFNTTEVGTDIIIMKNYEYIRKDFQKLGYSESQIEEKIEEVKKNSNWLYDNNFFKIHPEKVLGKIVQKTNQFGELKDVCVCNDGLTVEDELNKISDFAKEIQKSFEKNENQKTFQSQPKIKEVVNKNNSSANEKSKIEKAFEEINKAHSLYNSTFIKSHELNYNVNSELEENILPYLDRYDYKNIREDEINFYNQKIYYNPKTKESLLCVGHSNKVIAISDETGRVIPKFKRDSEEYRNITKTNRDKLEALISNYRKEVEGLRENYIGEKDNASYFKNIFLIQDFKYVFIDQNDNEHELSSYNTNIYASVIGAKDGKVINNKTYLKRNPDIKPFYATFDTLFPDSGKVDLSKAIEENSMILMTAQDKNEELKKPEDINYRIDSSETIDKKQTALDEYFDTVRYQALNEMLYMSKLTEAEYENKVAEYTINRQKILREQAEKKQKEIMQHEKQVLVFEKIYEQYKNGLKNGLSFDYQFETIQFKVTKDNSEAFDVYIDSNPVFCIDDKNQTVNSYNNFDVPKEFLKLMNEHYDGNLKVSDKELKQEAINKLSLSGILAGRKVSEQSKETAKKVSEFMIDRDVTKFSKSEKESYPSKTMNINNHSFKVVKYGIHTKLFIDNSNFAAADYDIKTNSLSLFQDSLNMNLQSEIESLYKSYYSNLEVKKDFVIDNTHYLDTNGNTLIVPMSAEKYIPNKMELMSDAEFSKIYGIKWNKEERSYWIATNWKGYIDLSKISQEKIDALPKSENYFEEEKGKWIHKTLFASGNIYEKLKRNDELLNLKQISEDSYKKNKAVLESAVPPKVQLQDISVSVKSPFVRELEFDGIPVKECFLEWATNSSLEDSENRRDSIYDFAVAGISRDDIPPTITWKDVVEYCDGVEMDAIYDRSMTAEEKSNIRNQKLNDRKDTAEKLFTRFIQNYLTPEQKKQFVDSYNEKFNNYKAPDYSTLPLFINGMNKFRFEKEFELYEQQIKGISFLSNKGNGLLAYDVGVGKTATGIAATVNQIQSGRAKRPLIVVPKSVIKKWEKDIHELFPEVPVNVLGNLGEKASGKYYDGNHGLNIPEGSITLVTYQALEKFAFTKETIDNDLFQDYADLLAVNDELESDNPRERALAEEKIYREAGVANKVSDSYYVFFEKAGFDHITVDEAHNFKNLFKVPRPRKGEHNEFQHMGSGKPSARALKMFNLTQLIQKKNNDRNVFMLTATPFTNSPLEVYSMLTYIARKEMERANIKDLNSFCEQYSKTRLELVVDHANNVKLSNVMKEFNDLNGLQNILQQFIDKVDGEEAGIIRPDKVVNPVIIEPTDVQKEIFDFAVNEVMEYVPEKGEKAAPILQGMNILRLAALSPALLTDKHITPFDSEKVTCNAMIPPIEEVVECSPKLKMVCDSVIKVWKENKDKGQVIYMPEGTEAYPHIINYMKKQGIPESVFASITGQESTIGGKKISGSEAREDIAQQFNDKSNPCKILIGSSAIAEGMDLNGNSVALYNCQLGWNPTEPVQVEGRIWRQGNDQGRVHIVYPLVEGSIDSFLYQKHDEKKSRIDEIFNFKGSTLNVAGIDPEQMKWELIKDPYKRAKLELNESKAGIEREILMLENQLSDYDSLVTSRKKYEETLAKRKEDKAQYEKNYQLDLFEGKQRRTEEEQQTGLKRYDMSIAKIEGQLKNIERKFVSMGIKDIQDELQFSTKISAKKEALERKIELINSPENVKQIAEKYKKIIEQERLKNLEMQLKEPLNKVITKDMIPAYVNEYNVRKSRYLGVINNPVATKEAKEKAQNDWNEFKESYDEKYSNKTQQEIKTPEPPKPEVKAEVEEKKADEKVYKTSDINHQFSFDFGDNEPEVKHEQSELDLRETFKTEVKVGKITSPVKHDFMISKSFYPAICKKGNDYILRCKGTDLTSEVKSDRVDVIMTKEQITELVAAHKTFQKVENLQKGKANQTTPEEVISRVIYNQNEISFAKITNEQKNLIKEFYQVNSEEQITEIYSNMLNELVPCISEREKELLDTEYDGSAGNSSGSEYDENEQEQNENWDLF